MNKRRVAAGILICLTIVGAAASYFFIRSENTYETYTAMLSTADTAVPVKGVISCTQIPIHIPATGAVCFMIQDGERTAENGEIARIYASQSSVDSARQIKELTNEVNDLTLVRSQADAKVLSPETVASEIRNVCKKINTDIATGNTSEIANLRRDMTKLLNYESISNNQTQAFDARITQLNTQISSLNASMGSYSSIRSTKSGYFFSNCVNHIQLSDSQIASVTPQSLTDLLNQAKTAAKSAGPTLITSYTYDFVFSIPAKSASLISSDHVNIVFKDANGFIADGQIISTNVQSGSDTAVMAVNIIAGSENALGGETTDAKVIIPGQAGLRVPKTALRTSVVNGAEVSGVYVLIGPEMEFRRVDVLMTDGDYVICNNNKKDGWLQLYDHVIVSGKNLDNDRVIRN